MNDNSPMLARLSAFVIWALVAGVAMFWGLRLLVRPAPPPPNVVAVHDASSPRGDLSRLLGTEERSATVAAPPESSRFRLLGVMAGKAVAGGLTPGVALISIDGKPARTYGAGARVDKELVVQSLGRRTASLGPVQGPAAFVLEVPSLSAAATGTLAPPAVPEPAPASAGGRPAGSDAQSPGGRRGARHLDPNSTR